jgi:hypothetical protein
MRARDQGIVFQRADTRAELESQLLIGYKIVNELVDGVTVPSLPDGLKHYSFLTSLLVNHGLELREWLAENGCVCRCGDPIRNGGTSDVEAVTHET